MIPPQAPEVEESILGAILLMPESLNHALDVLRADDFYIPENKLIFEAIVDLQQAGKPVDMLTVGDKTGVDLSQFIANQTMNIEYACQVVKERSMKRSIISACQSCVSTCYDQDSDVYEALDGVRESLYDVDSFSVSNLHRISDSVQALVKRIEEIQQSGEPIGIKTGLDLDNTLRGFQDGKYYIIAARPSMGKTALVMTFMRELARSGISSGIISLETSHISLTTRLVSQVCGIPAERITSGQMTSEEMAKFMDGCEMLSKYGIQIDDGSGITSQQLRSKCYAMATNGAKIIFIDFLQLVNEQGRSRHEEIGKISKLCKSISKDLNMPIVALSQLSRKVEDRTNKRPQLADLRESGSLEEDADAVMFLYRPEYYGIEKDETGNSTEGIAEIIVSKNKDGRVGSSRHVFEKETMTFKNFVRDVQYPF